LLVVQADLRPPQWQAQASAAGTLNANIQPWQTQRWSAPKRWQALNLAALWPQSPANRYGRCDMSPAGTGWRGAVQLRIAAAGLNQQRLPLESLMRRSPSRSGVVNPCKPMARAGA
jgi:hypothetical protein